LLFLLCICTSWFVHIHISEVITCAEFHPSHCNTLAYSSSKGSIRLIDLRQSALCDNHSKMLVTHPVLLSLTFYPSVLATLGTCMKDWEYVQLFILHKLLYVLWVNKRPLNRFEEHEAPGSRSFFTEIIASISDIKFSRNGRYILSRDYMTLKVCSSFSCSISLLLAVVHPFFQVQNTSHVLSHCFWLSYTHFFRSRILNEFFHS